MRILIVGSDEEWAIENHYCRHMNRIPGIKAEIFSMAIFAKQNLTWAKRIERRFFVSNNSYHQMLNSQLAEVIKNKYPDVVWVFKGMEIFPWTIKKLKKYALWANYNPDHPFIFSSRGHGNHNVRASVGLYDLYFSYHKALVNQLKNQLEVDAYWVPFGYELSESLFHQFELNKKDLKRIGFVGNPDAQRIKTIKLLLDANLPVDVYGNNWSRCLGKHKNLTIHKAVYGTEFWQKLMMYRIQLNIFRKHNINSHNMRSMEIPAAGSIQLGPDSPEHQNFFSHGREAFWYQSGSDLIDFSRLIMNMDTDEAQAIGRQARLRITHDGHTYEHRAQTIANYFIQKLK